MLWRVTSVFPLYIRLYTSLNIFSVLVEASLYFEYNLYIFNIYIYQGLKVKRASSGPEVRAPPTSSLLPSYLQKKVIYAPLLRYFLLLLPTPYSVSPLLLLLTPYSYSLLRYSYSATTLLIGPLPTKRNMLRYSWDLPYPRKRSLALLYVPIFLLKSIALHA